MFFELAFPGVEHEEIVSRTKKLVAGQRKGDSQLLVHIREIYLRKIYSMKGYSNLGDYCYKELGISPDMAYKYSKVSRALGYFPELVPLLEQGKTFLSHLAVVVPKLTEANKEKVLSFIEGKSRREIKEFMGRIDGDGTLAPEPELVELRVMVPREALEDLKKAHGLTQGKTSGEVLAAALKLYIEKKDLLQKPERKKTTPTKAGTGSKPNRYIPASVRREVREKSGRRCEFVSADGKRCEETRWLEFDHIVPFALGGSHTPGNIRDYCREHNQFSAEVVFGKSFRDQKFRAPPP